MCGHIGCNDVSFRAGRSSVSALVMLSHSIAAQMRLLWHSMECVRSSNGLSAI
jgi:hypothetical protein